MTASSGKDSGFVPIKPVAVDLTAAATAEQQESRAPGKLPDKLPLSWLGAAAALFIVAMVFFLLPEWVTDPVVEPGNVSTRPSPDAPGQGISPDSAPQTARSTTPTGDAPWEKAQQFSQRKESQEILGQLLETQKTLEESGVTAWGKKEYGQAIEHAKSGDAEYSRQNYSQAHHHYVRALDILTGLLQGVEQLFSDTMQAGNSALAAGDAVAAEEAFSLALAIDPIDRAALLGMERVGTLTEVMDLIGKGDGLLRDGKAEQAKALYQQALELDSHSELARKQLQSAENRISEDTFNLAMSSGFRLLEQGEYVPAHDAFSRALKIKPRSRDARSGLDQAQQRITAQNINALLKEAAAAEQAEDWPGASSAYEATLKLDQNLGNARDGKRRADLRNEIHNKLEQALAQPERLFDRSVYNEMLSFHDKIQTLSQPGPILAGQLAKLSRLLRLADTPVAVQFRSDNLTLVTLYKVGELGYFTSKNLSLRPGNYVAVGQREGYRDVRVEFIVNPDQAMDPVIISSDEKVALGR